MIRKLSITFCAALLGAATSADAHHSFLREYDPDNVVTIRGTVTEVWYQNPHSRVYLEDADAVVWETETYPRNILDRRGWKHDDLAVGDEVVVTGRRARNGSPRLQILSITRPSDGWEGVGFDEDSID
jgi:hypothetical protein